jgi:hypothetical protein
VGFTGPSQTVRAGHAREEKYTVGAGHAREQKSAAWRPPTYKERIYPLLQLKNIAAEAAPTTKKKKGRMPKHPALVLLEAP